MRIITKKRITQKSVWTLEWPLKDNYEKKKREFALKAKKNMCFCLNNKISVRFVKKQKNFLERWTEFLNSDFPLG